MRLLGPPQLAPFAGVVFPGDPGFSWHYAAALMPCVQTRGFPCHPQPWRRGQHPSHPVCPPGMEAHIWGG